MTRDNSSYASRHGGWYGSKWIRRERRLAIYLRDSFRCIYCDRELHHSRPADITLDHIDPVTPFGGDNSNTNLVTACRDCNNDKRDMPIELYAADRPALLERIERQRNAPINLALAKAIVGRRPKRPKSYAYALDFQPETDA